MEKISIIIPFKDTPFIWFQKLLDSLDSQINKNFEAIFIDDNSKESWFYKKIIEERGYSYFLNKQKIGVGRLRDLGLGLSKFKYIWFIDSDDWISKDAVDYLLGVFWKHWDIDVVMFEYKWVFNYRDIAEIKQKKIIEYVSTNKVSKRNMRWFHNNYQTDWRVCFRKDFLLSKNIMHKRYDNLFEDVYYGLLWKTKFNKIFLTTKQLYYYNRMNTNSTLNNYKFIPDDLVKVLLENKYYLMSNGQFNDIWYYYVINWIFALFLLKEKNNLSISKKQLNRQLIGNKELCTIKNIGFNKIWMMSKFWWIRR